MIIRKPFAFLVEHFKIIHFILLIPIGYLGFMFYRLSRFFNAFVVAGYKTNATNVVGTYYNIIIPIAIIMIIIHSTLILLLFQRKDKTYQPYLIYTIVYTIIFAFSLLLPAFLSQCEDASLVSSTALILRGFASIIFYLQIVAAIFIILLGLGLNIKTGEFQDIRDEIDLEEEDSEEVEINVSNEDYKTKRWLRRYFREIKYYIIENKNIFKVLGGIVGAVILFFVGSFILSLNKVVKVDQSFKHTNFTISFNASLLSTLDYHGKVISDGKIYLANKVTVTNITNDLKTINASDFWLDISGTYYYPVLDRSGKFLDLAKPYYGEKIGAGATNEYVLVYELDESEARSQYNIKVLDSITYKKNQMIPNYKQITLTPSFSNSVSKVGEYTLNEEISFKDTTLLNTTFMVSNYEISQSYRYSYDYCYQEECSKSTDSVSATFGKYLLILENKLSLDENSSYFKNRLGSNNFYEDFVEVQYDTENMHHSLSVKDLTPKGVEDHTVLEVNSSIKDADNLYLNITIRNKQYTIKLK